MVHQRDLLDETRDFFEPDSRAIKGVNLHDGYIQYLHIMGGASVVGTVITLALFDFGGVVLLGFVIGAIGLSGEVILKSTYRFTEKDAVRYHALQFMDNPTQENFDALVSWNQNPFYLDTQYHYPVIGKVTESAMEEEDPVDALAKGLPDAIRVIERIENDDFQTLIDIDKVEYGIAPHYQTLLTEANYCYKFGAYTSTAVLIRKITENILDEILTAKGLYSELSGEQTDTFSHRVTLFVEHVASGRYKQGTVDRIEHVLDNVVREQGNRSVHEPIDLDEDEARELVHEARWVLILLLDIKQELDADSLQAINADSEE